MDTWFWSNVWAIPLHDRLSCLLLPEKTNAMAKITNSNNFWMLEYYVCICRCTWWLSYSIPVKRMERNERPYRHIICATLIQLFTIFIRSTKIHMNHKFSFVDVNGSVFLLHYTIMHGTYNNSSFCFSSSHCWLMMLFIFNAIG